MKFEKALQAMREGKKVRRARWNKQGYIFYDDESEKIKAVSEQNPRKYEFDGTLINDDILAEDWEIYEEKEWHRTTAECTVKGAKDDDTLTFSSKKTCAYAVEKYNLYINIPGFMTDLTDRRIQVTIETID